jgi:hypothetical protein
MKTYALNPIEVRNANEEENEILKNLRKANLFFIKSDNDKIPVLLRRLHPKLNNREYKEIKDLMEFQEHKVLICQECYMELIQYLDFAGGEEFLLESIKGKANNQRHGNKDLTIKRLEKLKIPFYEEKKQMIEKMKTICSYHKEKKCGFQEGQFPSNIRITAEKPKTLHREKSFFSGYVKGKTLSFHENSSRVSRIDNETEILVEKYAGGLEEEKKTYPKAFKRLEQKIMPIKKKQMSLHRFRSLKTSLDSTNTQMTSFHEGH